MLLKNRNIISKMKRSKVTDYAALSYLNFDEKSQRVHLCTGLTSASWDMEPVGEIGVDFSLQLSSRTQFAKISN